MPPERGCGSRVSPGTFQATKEAHWSGECSGAAIRKLSEKRCWTSRWRTYASLPEAERKWWR